MSCNSGVFRSTTGLISSCISVPPTAPSSSGVMMCKVAADELNVRVRPPRAPVDDPRPVEPAARVVGDEGAGAGPVGPAVRALPTRRGGHGAGRAVGDLARTLHSAGLITPLSIHSIRVQEKLMNLGLE